MRSLLVMSPLLLVSTILSGYASPTGGTEATSPWGYHRAADFYPVCQVGSCTSGCTVQPGQLGHTALGGGFKAGFEHTNCWAGNSCEAHGTCSKTLGPDPEFLKIERQYADAVGLVEEAAEGSVEAVRALVRFHGAIATFNAKRHALQLTGCNGTSIIASVPLSAAQAEVFVGD